VIFFGLVSGFEIELGYFTLAELQSAHGGLDCRLSGFVYEPRPYAAQSLHAASVGTVVYAK